MTCRVFVDRIPDHLAGELEPGSLRDFLSHRDACPECQAYLRAYEATVTLARQAFDTRAGLPPRLRRKLIGAVLRARPKPEDR